MNPYDYEDEFYDFDEEWEYLAPPVVAAKMRLRYRVRNAVYRVLRRIPLVRRARFLRRLSLAQVDAVLRDLYLPAMQEQLNQSNVLLDRVRRS